MVVIELSQLEPKQKGTVVRVRGMGSIRQRMMDMGLVNGAEVEVLRVAPLGDPMELSIRGYNLSLRKSEAASIEVATNPVFPLTQAPENTPLQIVDFHSGFGLKQRLNKVGLNFGALIQKTAPSFDGGKINVLLDGKEILLGQGMAQKVIVQVEEGNGHSA